MKKYKHKRNKLKTNYKQIINTAFLILISFTALGMGLSFFSEDANQVKTEQLPEVNGERVYSDNGWFKYFIHDSGLYLSKAKDGTQWSETYEISSEGAPIAADGIVDGDKMYLAWLTAEDKGFRIAAIDTDSSRIMSRVCSESGFDAVTDEVTSGRLTLAVSGNDVYFAIGNETEPAIQKVDLTNCEFSDLSGGIDKEHLSKIGVNPFIYVHDGVTHLVFGKDYDVKHLSYNGLEWKEQEVERAEARSVAARASVLENEPKGDWVVTKNDQKLIVDNEPKLITNEDGKVVGVDALVRLFKGDEEKRIDPHRVAFNIPNNTVDNEDKITFAPADAYWEWLWDDVLSNPNEKGWRTRGTVNTFFSETSDDYLFNQQSTYSAARSSTGVGIGSTDGSDSSRLGVGQGTGGVLGSGYIILESFIKFDTSAIPDGDVVSSADLSLYGAEDQSLTNFTVGVYADNWGTSVTSADWDVTVSSPVASDSTSGFTTSGYNLLGDVASSVSKTSLTYFLLVSSRTDANTTPSQYEYVYYYSSGFTGTTRDPKLVVTYNTPNEAPTISSGPTVDYGSYTRTGPNNTPITISFTATDPEESGTNELSYVLDYGGGPDGTIIASGTLTSGVQKVINMAYNASGLVETNNTPIYLKISDGTSTSVSLAFSILRDDTVPTSATSISTDPSPVESSTYDLYFTPHDATSTSSNEISYQVRTAAGGGGTQLGSGTATNNTVEGPVSITDNGLSIGSNTRYIRQCDGANNCSDTSFTVTKAATPTVTTDAETNLIPTEATLNATVNPNGGGTVDSPTYLNATTSNNSGSSSLSWSHTVGAGSNRILVVSISTRDSSPGNIPTTITYGGQSLTKIGDYAHATNELTVSMWYLLENGIASASNTTISVTLNGVTTGTVGGATSWAGVNQSSPLGTFVGNESWTTAPSVNVTTAAGDVVLDVVTLPNLSGDTNTPGANQTQRWNGYADTGQTRGLGSSEVATGTTTTMSWSTKQEWVVIGAVPIKPISVTPSAWFRYDTSNPGTCNDSFGTKSPTNGSATGSGSENVPVSQVVTGLEVGSTIYYCAIAENNDGKAYGSVRNFTVPGGGNCNGVPLGGDYTITTSCTFGSGLTTYDGVDKGTGTSNTGVMTINPGVTLTLAPDQTIAWGSIVKPGATIVKFSGGVLQKGPLWVPDADGDAYPAYGASFTGQVFSSSQPAGYTRRLNAAGTTADCNDDSSHVYREISSLVADADQDGYYTGSSGTQCVGDSTVIEAGTVPDSQTFNSTGTWQAPSGVTSVSVEAWGGGGGGRGGSDSSGGGGGGGGAYAAGTATVTPGNTYNVVVGTGGSGGIGSRFLCGSNCFGGTGGDSYFNTTGTIMAKGGGGSNSTSGAAGGSSTSSVGTTKRSGGAGGNRQGFCGGGGGGSAGATGNGGTGGSPITAGSAGSGGGATGGSGGCGSNGGSGNTPGAGGGGGYGDDFNAGAGASGRVILNWEAPASKTYYKNASGDYGFVDPSGLLGGSDCNDNSSYVYQEISSLVEDADQDGYYTGFPTSPCVGDSTSVNVDIPLTSTPLTNGFDTDTSSANTISISPKNGSMVFVFVRTYDACGVTTPTVSGLSQTWTQVTTGSWTAAFCNNQNLTIFRSLMNNPGSGALTIATPGRTSNGIHWAIIEVLGADTGGTNGSSSVVQTSASSTGTSSTPATTLSTFGSSENGALFGVVQQGPPNSTPESGWTEAYDTNTSLGLFYRTGQDTTPSVTTSTASEVWGVRALEVKKGGPIPMSFYRDSSGNYTWVSSSQAVGSE